MKEENIDNKDELLQENEILLDPTIMEKAEETATEAVAEESEDTAEEAPQEKPAEEETHNSFFNAMVNDEDDENSKELKHFKDLMQAMSIDGMWFYKQLGVLTLALIGVILYVTNRYMAQQEMIEEDRLTNELQDWKYRSMTRNSELTLRCRQSQLEQQLKAQGDSTLLPNKGPIYKLPNNK